MAKKKSEAIKEQLVARMSNKDGIVWFSTGNVIKDNNISCGAGAGIAGGGIHNVCGLSGSGKSYDVIETLVNNIYTFGDKLKYRYKDTEGGSMFDTQALYGITLKPEWCTPIKTVEDFQADFLLFLETIQPDEYGIYITDSWDGLTGAEIELRAEERTNAYARGKEYDDGSFLGGKNKFASSELFPIITSKLANMPNVCLIITSQVRENVNAGLYAPKHKVTGGAALLFYSTSRSWLKPVEFFEVDGHTIGATVQIESKKGRGPFPYRKDYINLWYTYGFDAVSTCVDYLYELKTDLGKLNAKANKELNWDEDILPDRASLIKYIEANNLEEELFERTKAMIKSKQSNALSALSERKPRFGKNDTINQFI